MKYLEKGGRALAHDFVNCSERADDFWKRDWAKQMDDMREWAGTNESRNGQRTRTYNHYVLSPDPRDNLTLEQMREFAVAWSERWFGDFQCAIVYHDDNENNILHAHIIVNNVNLETGKRLAPYLTKAKVREISAGTQEMARERGMHYFRDADDPDTEEEKIDLLFGEQAMERDTKSKAISSARDATEQKGYITRAERGLTERGVWSWKTDLRARVECARNLAVDERDFLNKCADLDLKVTRAANGDYLFTHPERDTWRARGNTLGAAYKRDAILRELVADARFDAPKPNPRQYSAVQRHLNALRSGHVRTVGFVDPATGITLADMARATETNRRYDIHTAADYAVAIAANRGDKNAIRELKEAERVSAATHLLDFAERREQRAATRKLNKLTGTGTSGGGKNDRHARPGQNRTRTPRDTGQNRTDTTR